MLLLTAFEPFDETGINSSLETLREVERRQSSLATVVLPVRYGDDFEVWRSAVERHQPDAVLMMGQSSRARVEIERVAVNLNLTQFEPPQHHIILPDAPAAYFTTWPLESLLQRWAARDLPAISSAHAGTYVCNHIFYRALHFAAQSYWRAPIGFVHLPRLPEQMARAQGTASALPLETLVDCVQIAIDH